MMNKSKSVLNSGNGKEQEVAVTDMDSMDNVTVVRDCSGRGPVKSNLQTRALPVTDPVKEAEILENIEAAYFIEEGFDATDYELKKVVDTDMLPEDLSAEMDKLKRQLQVVSKRVSAMIIQNSPSYSAQLKDIGEIQFDLNDVLSVIQNIRRKFGQAKCESRNGLEILANYRNRKFLRNLLSSLKAIKTLYEAQFQMNDLVQEENFPAAITMCREAQKATAEFSHFDCIKELSMKLEEALEDIEMNLDNCLASLTVVFDVDRYSMVYTAYKMLNKVEESAMKVVGFTRATLESSARTVIIDKILSDKVEIKVEELSYEQLCEAVGTEQILDCVRELGFVICKVLFTYHAILLFHMDEDERLECAQEGSEDVGVVRKVLVDSLYSIFKTASMKFNTLLCCHDLSLLKIDQFMDIIEMSNRFKHFGRTYFGNICGEVTMSLEKQSEQYFKRYHRERMDELRMFLENEAFALCPLPLQFTLFDLQEFNFLKESNECRDGFDSPVHSETNPDFGESLDFQVLQPTDRNPFSVDVANTSTEGPDTDLNKIEKKLTNGSIESDGYDADDSFSQLAPILCNTSLNLLRFIGKYIRMTYMLHSVAYQAVSGIFELCNYFFFTVHSFFSSDVQTVADHFFSSKLKNVVDNLESDLFSDDSPSKGASMVQLDSEPGYALCERIVGAESINFTSKQLDLIRPVIESLVGDKGHDIIENYYTEVLSVIPEMRECIYGCVASRFIDCNRLVNDVAMTKWDISELQSQHSAYIDSLLQELESVKNLLSEIEEHIPVAKPVQKSLWSAVIYCSFRALVQGYGEYGKKCSNEGRALMQLDFQQLIAKLEQLVSFMPIPHKAYVENYIKAYYLPESSMETWIQQHSEYTTNQIITLLNVATHVSKKARTRIISALDE